MRSDCIIDGLRVKRVGENNFRIVRDYVDEIVTLPDAEIFEAMLWIMSRSSWWWKARRQHRSPHCCRIDPSSPGSKVVCVLSGGNVNLDQLRGLKWN